MTPDYTEARKAAHRVFAFLKKIPNIDSYSEEGTRPVSNSWYSGANVFGFGNYNRFYYLSVIISGSLDLYVAHVGA